MTKRITPRDVAAMALMLLFMGSVFISTGIFE